MNNNFIFDTYLFISPKKFTISVNQKSNLKNVYQQNKIMNNNSEEIDLNSLNNFLNQNIFKIEKLLNTFIESVILIINTENFFQVEISTKQKNYGKKIDLKNISYMLNDAKDQCFETFKDKKIIHILINNYNIDNQNYSNRPENLNCNYISLDISFICISNHFLKMLEEVIKRYHISPSKIISAKYIKSLFPERELDFIKSARQLIDGYNQNEVVMTEKISKKQGFFEKFFHFFN